MTSPPHRPRVPAPGQEAADPAPIRTFTLTPYRLPLSRPWHLRGASIQVREGWRIGLEDAAGRRGWGEAAPWPALGTETLEQCQSWLADQLTNARGVIPAALLERLPPAPSVAPAARCGLEMALLDLLARAAGQPLGIWLDPRAPASVAVNDSLGPLVQVDAAALARSWERGFGCVKLKLGRAPMERERTALQALARDLPEGGLLRLDANGAWTLDQAARFLDGLAGLPVELLEEPLARPTPGALQVLARHSPVALALDESLGRLPLERVLEERLAAVLVLKPMCQGGLLPCRELARRARDRGLGVVITTSLDGALATTASAHLAASLDGAGAPRHHGLATSTWLARDLAPPPETRAGRLGLPPGPGLGLEPFAD